MACTFEETEVYWYI